MAFAVDLNTYILGSLKDEDSGRVALYHYLRNCCEPQRVVSPEVINEFFAEALQLSYWRDKRKELYSDVQDLLQKYFASIGEPFRLDLLWDVSRFQIVAVEQRENLFQIIHAYEKTRQKEGEKLRVLQSHAQGGAPRTIVIKQDPAGNLMVSTYNNLVRLQGASLVPLLPDQELFYDAGLELVPGALQKLKPSPHSQVRFVVGSEGIGAQFIAGYAFRQTQELHIEKISDEPRIFYPLKRLERFFVHRPSDPYYMQTLSGLDQALRLMQSRAEGALAFALQAFDNGQIAFDQIFPDDKALYMKLRELAKWIAASRPQQAMQPKSPAANRDLNV